MDPASVSLAKTADRSVLGCMNDMAFMCEASTDRSGGLATTDLADLNQAPAPDPAAATPLVLGVATTSRCARDNTARRHGAADIESLALAHSAEETVRRVVLCVAGCASGRAAHLPLTAAAAYAEGAAAGRCRWQFRSPTGGICGTTWPRRSSVLPQAAGEPPAEQAAVAPERPLAARTRERHHDVHNALARGLTITASAARCGCTAKRSAVTPPSPTLGDLIPDAPLTRRGLLDPHVPYLHQRWADGVHSTQRLHHELRTRGYTGSLRTLRRVTA